MHYRRHSSFRDTASSRIGSDRTLSVRPDYRERFMSLAGPPRLDYFPLFFRLFGTSWHMAQRRRATGRTAAACLFFLSSRQRKFLSPRRKVKIRLFFLHLERQPRSATPLQSCPSSSLFFSTLMSRTNKRKCMETGSDGRIKLLTFFSLLLFFSMAGLDKADARQGWLEWLIVMTLKRKKRDRDCGLTL